MAMFERLMKGLAEKGHEVDVLSHFPLKKPIPRYNDISVRWTIPSFVNNISISFARENFGNSHDMVKFMLFEGGVDTCRAVLNSTAAKELKYTKKQYDLVITEVCSTDCMLGFAHHFKIPVIGITSSVDLPWGGIRIGNPDNPSYIPNYFERLINTMFLLAVKLGYETTHSYANAVTREFFGPDLPGSMILTETLPTHKLKAFFEAFGELPYKVLWKAVRENMPKDVDIPSNIQFEPWMPQIDILCLFPLKVNVKLFVTHGGLMGTQEGIFCGVPRLGIPFFADQALNLKTSEAMDLAIIVDYDDITKETILNAEKALLEDRKYKNNAERVSKLFKDRPLSPIDTAIYWTEYVIKHNGAPHLRTVGADLPWYQYYLVDVGAILLTLLVIFKMIIYYLIICIVRIIMSNRRNCQPKPKSD